MFYVCLRIQIPFSFSTSLIKTEGDSRVGEQTAEVIGGEATVPLLTLNLLKIKAGFTFFFFL